MTETPSNDHTSVGDRSQQGAGTRQQEAVVIRFSGDSGDGMQTVGEKFSDSSVLAGNDISTFPDYPAEIRAPAAGRAGSGSVSASWAYFWSWAATHPNHPLPAGTTPGEV